MNKIIQTRYQKIVKRFFDKKCKVVTTCDEYIKITDEFKKINIIASCGHNIDNVYIHTFFNRNSGTRCKECVKKDTINILKSKTINCFETDFLAFNILKENLQDFIVEKTVEGCLVDIIIKPKNNTNNFLPIQLKSTLEKNFNCYSFSGLTKDKYKNMIIILVCVNEKICWVLNNENITSKFKINIGMKSKKYGKFQIDITKLNEMFIKLYNEKQEMINTKEHFNNPINIYQKREHEYRQIRTSKINFLDFVDPLLDSQQYDFTINNMKVQEKVCGIRKDRNQYTCQLVKNNGVVNGKRTHINYMLGDNDFYWINIPDNNTFYIFPEKVLYDMDKINTNKKVTLNIPFDDTNYWTNKYKFYYNNLDKTKILEILNTKYIIKNKVESKMIINDNIILVDNLNKLVPDVIIKDTKITPTNKCVDCTVAIKALSTRCNQCNYKFITKNSIIKTNRPTLEQLEQDIKDLKYITKVASKYNVSDNSIRKWIDKYKKLI